MGFKASIRVETNNYVEAMALRFMLKCAKSKNDGWIHVCGDSSLITNCMKDLTLNCMKGLTIRALFFRLQPSY